MHHLGTGSPPLAWTTRQAPYLLALSAAVVGGVVVAWSPDPRLILLTGSAFVVGLIALSFDRLPALAFVSVSTLTLVLPDVFDNAGLRPQWVVLIGVSAAPLALYVRRARRPVGADLAIILVVIGASIPALVAGSVSALVANGILIVAAYVAGRLGAPGAGLVRTTVSAIAVLHVVVAVVLLSPATAGLVPFTPELGGIPYEPTRSTGLFNNPNQFGLLQAMTIAFLLWSGLSRRTIPIVVICAIGLLMSGSREAIFGLLLAATPLVIRMPGRVALALAVVALVTAAFVASVPWAVERFDPTGFHEDPSLLERFELWQSAISLIGRSPIYGYGLELTDTVVDQAYLGWLVSGGVIAAAAWLAGALILLVAVRPWPVIVLVLGAALLASVFSSSTLALLLLLSGALPRLPMTAAPSRGGSKASST